MYFNDNEKEAKFRSKVREFLDKNARKRTGSSSSAANAAAPETLQGKAAQIKALQDAKNWQAKKLRQAWQQFYGLKSMVALEVLQLNKLFISKKS